MEDVKERKEEYDHGQRFKDKHEVGNAKNSMEEGKKMVLKVEGKKRERSAKAFRETEEKLTSKKEKKGRI